MTKESLEIVKHYPRLTAHLIAESLGYFSVSAAAHAIKAYKDNKEWWCEWYIDIQMKGRLTDMKEINKYVIQRAIANRHGHKGSMASYTEAKKQVNAALQGKEVPEFGAWF
jgi:hypothetical protein